MSRTGGNGGSDVGPEPVSGREKQRSRTGRSPRRPSASHPTTQQRGAANALPPKVARPVDHARSNATRRPAAVRIARGSASPVPVRQHSSPPPPPPPTRMSTSTRPFGPKQATAESGCSGRVMPVVRPRLGAQPTSRHALGVGSEALLASTRASDHPRG